MSRLEDILSKVENGVEKYNKNPHFRQSVEVLLSGGEPIILIDQLTTIIDNILKNYEGVIKQYPYPFKYNV